MLTKIYPHVICCFVLLCACCLPALAMSPQDDGFTPYLEGKVAGVIDGSEIVVINHVTNQRARVRLRGTDAPEVGQAFGPQSWARLASLINGKLVRVEFKGTDRYGRIIGKVLQGDEDINLAQLAAGLAWFHTRTQNEVSDEDRQLYQQAEQTARASRRGLWKDSAPLEPWEYRSRNNISNELFAEDLAPPTQPPPAKPAARKPPARRKRKG